MTAETRLPHQHSYPGSRSPSRAEDPRASSPPWDIGRPQPAFLALAGAGAIKGRVLDVGCGTGEQVLMAADLGLDATGVDVDADALRVAREKARHRGLDARFLRQDARRLADLGESFDTVLDCGLFHMLIGDDRAAFVGSLRAALRPGDRYLMLCHSDQDPGSLPLHRVTRDEIAAAFADGWRIDSIEPSRIDVAIDPDGVRAWLVIVTRI